MHNAAEPLFSVIMPVYNHVEYVDEAIASVVNQTFPAWELCIVDDGSTDGSAELIDAWADKYPRIHATHQANAGPAVARNAAAARCKGHWLAFLDSDDLFFPATLQSYADFIVARPEVSFFYGYRHRLSNNGTITKLQGQFQNHDTGARELFDRMYLSHLCVCFERRLFERVGGYDTRLHSVEDYDLYLRISAHARFHPLGIATGLRRRHDANISRQTGYNRLVQATVLRRFIEQLGNRNVLHENQINRRLGKIYYAAGRQYFKERCFDEAVTAFDTGERFALPTKGKFLRLGARLLKPLGRHDGRTPPELQ